MQVVNRQEYKYFIKRLDAPLIVEFLKANLIRDPNDKGSGYEISSLYFDNFYDVDFNEKLDGIIYREKYRIRIYNYDIKQAKFEIKRKLNNCIQKISAKLSTDEIISITEGNLELLNNHLELEYAAHRMQYLGYTPKTIVTYTRKAFFLPYNDIRITLDCRLRTHGFHTDLQNLHEAAVTNIQLPELEILELKFSGELPVTIKKFLSQFTAVRSSISKYALSRIHNNTEIHGDDPVISF